MSKGGNRKKELRRFGQVIGVALGLLAALLFWRERPAAPYVLGAGGVFLVLSLIAPRVLDPFERAWMALARVLGAIMTVVMLTITFILLITPLGLLFRLIGKDMIDRGFDPEAETYWVPVEPDGPGSRPNAPY